MLAALLALLQHAPEQPNETLHGAAQEAAGHAAESEPWLVEQANHIFGPVALKVQEAVMPPIYHLFGAHWTPPPADRAIPEHVVFAIILFIICVVGVLLMRGRLSVDRPSKGQQMLEILVEQVRGLLDQVIGPYGRRYLPVIASFAIFILIGNLMSFIPGLAAPTESINVTGALGVTSFFYYIGMGFRQQGIRYLKHFTGGLSGWLMVIGVLIFFVEILSNMVRPVTLSLRLFVNMFADHQIAGSFLGLFAPIVPIFTIVLGLFVSFIQMFIFIMLSMVYLSETIPHEDHDHEEHAHTHEVATA
jgi:F-type H+-transporting ATPase subunit a